MSDNDELIADLRATGLTVVELDENTEFSELDQIINGIPLNVVRTPSTGAGTKMSWLRIHIFPPANFIVAEVGSYIFLMYDDGTWERYPYSALSDFRVQYGDSVVQLQGLEANRYILDRMGITSTDTQ